MVEQKNFPSTTNATCSLSRVEAAVFLTLRARWGVGGPVGQRGTPQGGARYRLPFRGEPTNMFGGLVGGDNSAAKPMATLPPSVPCAQGTALEGQQGLGSWSSLGPDGQGVARGRAVVQWPPPEPASGSPEPLSDADTEPDWGMPPTHDALGDPTPSSTGRVGDGQRQGPRPGSGWELSEADGLGGEGGGSQEWTLDCGGGLELNLHTIASADTPLNDQDGAPPSDHPARAIDAGTGATTGADGPSPKKRAVEMVAGPPNEPAEDPPKDPLATPLSRQRTLPTSRDGRPRPSGPWIAGMMYWIARNPALQAQTGVSVVPARINSNSQVNTPPFLTRRNRWSSSSPRFSRRGPQAMPAVFRVQQLGQFYHGAAVASLLREAMLLAGLELKLPGWCGSKPSSSPRLLLTSAPKDWQNVCLLRGRKAFLRRVLTAAVLPQGRDPQAPLRPEREALAEPDQGRKPHRRLQPALPGVQAIRLSGFGVGAGAHAAGADGGCGAGLAQQAGRRVRGRAVVGLVDRPSLRLCACRPGIR